MVRQECSLVRLLYACATRRLSQRLVVQRLQARSLLSDSEGSTVLLDLGSTHSPIGVMFGAASIGLSSNLPASVLAGGIRYKMQELGTNMFGFQSVSLRTWQLVCAMQGMTHSSAVLVVTRVSCVVGICSWRGCPSSCWLNAFRSLSPLRVLC